MAFSYTLPPASDRDRVRFLIADTDSDTHRVEDEEIDMALADNANRYMAAALLCDVLATKYGAKGKRSVGRLSIENSQIGSDYADRAKSLRMMANSMGGDGGGPEVLGQSESDRDTVNSDTDRTPDYFSHGMHDVHSPAAYQG